ncbi:MAG: hypothetical protein COV59_02555 [Candidatus Magasanikbacteria bacterium CG11_big_fil_rev_8_21_14_0_20_39_34]|uniref:YbaK/aminoacyl-tRNA synthetase-associated domain-containing protein n=1 Tax=Candidatus Magasanikbacteria bacterium CG11_big_fil_rev_8_21_14_0_20_39_34 TaxID=1974653 RepID=A0A2H0N574_9BACT|nr:MAG: hypothetical protein COV59_02555 [Candidatus Magasanikbacteria bacterium CG11_big_fil_rev_8_21_14_0_20_39_34]
MELQFVSALSQEGLLADSVKKQVEKLKNENIEAVAIDPQFMGGFELCEKYGVKPEDGANCVVIEGIRGEESTFAACLIPVNCKKADFNGVVRKHLGVRRVSLANLNFVLEKTGMEYGSITVVGLPTDWKIFIDPSVVSREKIIIGSGLQKSKLRIPTTLLLELPGAEVLEGLCKEKTE